MSTRLKAGKLVLSMILIMSIAISVSAQTDISVEDARERLKESHSLNTQRKHREAIVILEQLVAYNSKLEISYPEENITLQAMGELGVRVLFFGNV